MAGGCTVRKFDGKIPPLGVSTSTRSLFNQNGLAPVIVQIARCF